jgi:hypothetical protein
MDREPLIRRKTAISYKTEEDPHGKRRKNAQIRDGGVSGAFHVAFGCRRHRRKRGQA